MPASRRTFRLEFFWKGTLNRSYEALECTKRELERTRRTRFSKGSLLKHAHRSSRSHTLEPRDREILSSFENDTRESTLKLGGQATDERSHDARDSNYWSGHDDDPRHNQGEEEEDQSDFDDQQEDDDS